MFKEPRRTLSKESGFTLLEVIVALMIAGFALGAMLTSLETGLASGSQVDRSLRAISLAHSQLDAILATPTLRPGTQSYEIENSYRSTIEIRQIATSGSSNDMERLALFSVGITVDREGSPLKINLTGRAVRPAVQE
ncbi:type IV pilus modification PilV family protein [Kozakia baliensis]|uniref:Uncharacterized protein n=1 Tax=Kozakia baliensis TaxID=153496 RepID=A0A1D8UYL7_9PROT|nr:type II secretion system protein [Kozakia baliensis]AOX18730.1 hypothetical protein A0U89_15575 [Kozakia baliensis]GEL64948.1 hypothetical protein KBA01_22340 [Kozakia baliensis]